MSFGFGLGDILTVSKLALNVYNAYKDAPANFRNISHEIESLHIILARENDRLVNMTFQTKDQQELRKILRGCEAVLRDLDNLLIKYKKREGSVLKFVVQVKLGFEDISELRARLISNTTLFNTFITRCAMDEIKDLITNGAHASASHAPGLRRTGSISSLASFAPSLNSKATWKKLCRDLHQAGVTAEVIRQRGPQVHAQVLAFLQNETVPVEGIIVSQSASASQALRLAGNDGELPKQDAQVESGSGTLVALPGPIRVGTPSLIAAAAVGDAGRVRELLKVFREPEYRVTALHTAAGYGHVGVVRLLLKKGVNIEARRSDIDGGGTVLDSAACAGHADVVKLLLEKGANIEATRSDNGATALHTAAWCGHSDVVGLLLEKGANMEATRSDRGGTVLASAACAGHTDIVKLLLEKGANIEAARSACY